MWWTIGRRVIRGFVVLWMTAIGGIVGANLLGLIATLLLRGGHNYGSTQQWTHIGWTLGTALFCLGAISGRLKFFSGPGLGSDFRNTASTGPSKTSTSGTCGDKAPDHGGILKGIFVGGIAGGFLGFMLGANLLVFWFSLAYSPFASQPVASSVQVQKQARPGHVTDRPVIQTRHPIALYLCLTPVLLGSLSGATTAGWLSWKYRDTNPS
ncbi:hypothetical protein GC163_14190 [bacterium]|nr:hypothetical protein [bacterium]